MSRKYKPFEYLNKTTNNKRLKEDESYTDFLIEEGFIDEDHKPLICKQCGNKEFYNQTSTWRNADRSEEGEIEEIRCKNCDSAESSFYFDKWLVF